MRAVAIDVVSDVMCPWCFIGKRRLERALALLDGIETTVRWRPFLLDPTIPPEGRDRKTYLERKFGGPERTAAAFSSATSIVTGSVALLLLVPKAIIKACPIRARNA